MSRLCAIGLSLLLLGAQAETPAARIAAAAALNGKRDAANALKTVEPLLTDPAVLADDSLYAAALRQAASAWFQLNDYPKALDGFDRALTLSRKTGDTVIEAAATYGRAQVLKNTGDYPAALQGTGDALRLYEATGDDLGRGRAYVLRGAVQDSMGSHREALESYQTAVPLVGRSNRALSFSVLNEMGITLKNLGLYQDALDHYAEALKGQVEIGDRYGQAVTLLNTGVAYNLLGEDDRALDVYQRCLTMVHEIGEKRGESIVLGNLGDLLADRGDDTRALEYYERQLALTRALGNKNEEAAALKAIGDVRARRGDFAAARQSHDAALALYRQSGAKRREGGTLESMALAALQQGHAAEAAALSRQAVALAQQTHSLDFEWRSHLILGRAERAAGTLDDAITEFRDAANIVNDLRANIGNDAGKIGFIDGRQDVFRELAAALLDAGRPVDALEAAEAGRARAFADLLEQRSVLGKTAERGDLSDVRGALDDVRAAAPTTTAATTRSGGLDERLTRLSAAHGELASLLIADSPRRDEILAVAARLRATLVEYLVSDRGVLAWVVSPAGTITAATLPLDKARLESTAAKLRRSLTARPSTAPEPPALASALRDLDARLVRPLRRWLPADPHAVVIIVPNGTLALLPFAAFEDAHGAPLAARHTLAFAPAISVYRYTPAKKRDGGERGPAGAALVVADPAPPPGSGLARLEGARREGALVARRLRPGAVTLLTGDAATEAAVKQLAPSQRVLHFATHGLVSSERPLASSLAFAAGGGEDGYLRVDEIFGLSLQADLVVLSGCSTGLGRMSGDGIVGLTRAFIYAGTPAVLVSQWDVSDRATAFLMDRFYAALAHGGGTAGALRTAQLETRTRYPDPSAWAGFILTGEPR